MRFAEIDDKGESQRSTNIYVGDFWVENCSLLLKPNGKGEQKIVSTRTPRNFP